MSSLYVSVCACFGKRGVGCFMGLGPLHFFALSFPQRPLGVCV